MARVDRHQLSSKKIRYHKAYDGMRMIRLVADRLLTDPAMQADEAKKKCPELQMVHVATCRLASYGSFFFTQLNVYIAVDREGDVEPGRWDDADPRTHKVSNRSHASVCNSSSLSSSVAGFS